ncbi:MAG: thiol:disulfide interchange protein DsbA/DsbL [Gammaproteobacteria bacterium]|nr:thiol:disulfide interchange protein DsbA/DsbL [Gammaproteobacteria bacterium]
MLKRSLILLLGSIFAMAACAAETPNEKFKEGIDYGVLPKAVATDVANKVEVIEFFYYGCPHCYHFEPHIQSLRKTMPTTAVFKAVPATFSDEWKKAARAYYALESLGALDKTHKPIFEAIHKHNKKLSSPESFADVVAAQGVDRKAFLDAMNAFNTDSKVNKASQLVMLYQVSGVPMLAVNGRYIVTGELAKSPERMIEITRFLINKEAKRMDLK